MNEDLKRNNARRSVGKSAAHKNARTQRTRVCESETLLPGLFSLFSGTQVRLPAMHAGYRMPRSLSRSQATEKEREKDKGRKKGHQTGRLFGALTFARGSRNAEISRLSTPGISTFNSQLFDPRNAKMSRV